MRLHTQNLTLLFVDIVGFTVATNHQSRAENAALISRLIADSPAALSDLGAALYMQGELPAAAEAFSQALQRQETAAVLSNLGSLNYYLGRYSESVRYFERALMLQADSAMLAGNLADANRQTGEQKKARQHYRRAVQLQNAVPPSDDVVAVAQRAHWLASQGDLVTAQTRIEIATREAPQNPEVFFFRALVAVRNNQRGEALAALQTAVALGYSRKLLSLDPDLRVLADDAGFLALVTRN